MSPVDPSSETFFDGTLFEFKVTLIPVKPGDVLEPRFGRPEPDRDEMKKDPEIEPPEVRHPE